MKRLSPERLLDELADVDDLLIVQDLDGVCMQLVKDPLTRQMDPDYVEAAARLRGSFMVLTNGEHERRRGVNRLVERALGSKDRAARDGLYLPGLAAGGVQFQDRFGDLSHPGVTAAEMDFLAAAPQRMEALLLERLPALLPEVDPTQLAQLAHQAVLDTEVSPTVNLNGLFGLIPNDLERQRQLQGLLEALMEKLLQEATQQGLDGSFFLHAAPNLGWDATGRERMKPSVAGDVGTTDIQFMLTGSLKEAGLLVLINRHIATRWGEPPLGEDFNVRTAPRTHQALMDLARAKIPPDKIPRLVGVGDTVTSTPAPDGQGWLRGGSDRGFLTLLKDLGQWCGQSNRVILVDSSHGEVDRPGLVDETLAGISDPEDPLHLDVLMPSGPEGYIQWFIHLSERRSQQAAD